MDRRKEIFNILKENLIPVIEDGFNEELLYSSSPIDPIAALNGKEMLVKWELVLDTAKEEKVVDSGLRTITYDHYGCTELEPLTITLPSENGVAKLRLYLCTTDGSIVMRNFLVYDVQGEVPAVSIAMKDFNCNGFKRAWCLQTDNKLNCIGDGTASAIVNKKDIPEYSEGKTICITFEASSKEELTKDRLDDNNTENDEVLDLMLGYRIDRGKNPNSYFQTDETLYPATIMLSVDNTLLETYELADAPADSRGCLSWHYQPNPRKNDEAGSYGYVCSAVIPADLAASLGNTFTVSIKGENGFSLYGRNSGRYPIGFEITAE